MTTIRIIVSGLIGLLVGLSAAYGFKNVLKKRKLILRTTMAIIVLFAVALLAAKLVEVIPDPHGSFGDWLGYWGNIIGGIIGAIVAAAVSYFVTTVTFSKLNHQRAIDENKFQVQVNLRTELLK